MADTLAPTDLPATPMTSPGKRKRDPEEESGDEVGEAEDHPGDESQNMDEEMTCGVCMEILDNPYSIIPCLHSVDYECLTEWWKSHNTCPVCATKAKSAKRSFQIRAIVEKYLATRPSKRRAVDPDDPAAPPGTTPNEIKPQGHNDDDPDLDEDDEDEDDEGDDIMQAERVMPVWPCFCCEPGNQYGYECPVPIPEPAQEVIDEAMRHFDHMADHRPRRGEYVVPQWQAHQRGIPGTDQHAGCAGCSRYIPIHRQPQKDQCARCSQWACAEYDPEGCPTNRAWTLKPRDDCDWTGLVPVEWRPPTNLHGVWLSMGNALAPNATELQILEDHVAASGRSFASIFADIAKGHLTAVEEDDAADDEAKARARRQWGDEARFCWRCCSAVVKEGLLAWWKKEWVDANLDPAIRAKPNCWYGVDCRTQMHNPGHAQKLNHICENTRGGRPAPGIPVLPHIPIFPLVP